MGLHGFSAAAARLLPFGRLLDGCGVHVRELACRRLICFCFRKQIYRDFAFARCIRPLARASVAVCPPCAASARSHRASGVHCFLPAVVQRAGQVVQFTLDVANDRFTFRMFFITFYVNNNGYIHLDDEEKESTSYIPNNDGQIIVQSAHNLSVSLILVSHKNNVIAHLQSI